MNQRSTYSNWWRSLSVALLLGSYLSAFLYSELHEVFHHEHHYSHESCSDEAEKDPCHRLVFHGDNSGKCSHDGHIHAPKHECELCDALIAQFDFPEVKTLNIKIFESEPTNFTFEEKINLPSTDLSIFLRGPPSLTI